MKKNSNLCFENNPDVIADVMNGCDDLQIYDCIEAIVGLGRIAARLQAQISNAHTDIRTLKREVKKGGDQVDSKFTVDQMKTVLQSVSEKMKSENFKDNELTYKIDSLSNQLEKAVTRNGGKKENVNIVLVIW